MKHLIVCDIQTWWVFDKVLLLSDDKKTKIGTPYLEKAHVEAEIHGEAKAEKVIIYKSKRRKKYRKKQGHRQIYTNLAITRIVLASSWYKSQQSDFL